MLVELLAISFIPLGLWTYEPIQLEVQVEGEVAGVAAEYQFTHILLTVDELFSLFQNLGYFGIFAVSFIGSVIVFVPIPYFPFLVTAALNKNLDPNIISLISALGAVIAKMMIFYASYYGRKVMSEKTKRKMLPLQKLLGRYGGLGAFVAALTPIPDDIVYIPLGLAKYNPWKFAIATFSGKFIFNEAIVWGSVILGRPFVEYFISNNVDPFYWVSGAIVGIVISGIMIFVFMKIDWSVIIGKWFPWAIEDKDSEDKEQG